MKAIFGKEDGKSRLNKRRGAGWIAQSGGEEVCEVREDGVTEVVYKLEDQAIGSSTGFVGCGDGLFDCL